MGSGLDFRRGEKNVLEPINKLVKVLFRDSISTAFSDRSRIPGNDKIWVGVGARPGPGG